MHPHHKPRDCTISYHRLLFVVRDPAVTTLIGAPIHTIDTTEHIVSTYAVVHAGIAVVGTCAQPAHVYHCGQSVAKAAKSGQRHDAASNHTALNTPQTFTSRTLCVDTKRFHFKVTGFRSGVLKRALQRYRVLIRLPCISLLSLQE